RRIRSIKAHLAADVLDGACKVTVSPGRLDDLTWAPLGHRARNRPPSLYELQAALREGNAMNTSRRQLLSTLLVGVAGASLAPAVTRAAAAYEVTHTDAEWRKLLSPAAYDVLRHQGTEPPWSSALEYEHRKGTYSCAGCDLALFSSDTK